MRADNIRLKVQKRSEGDMPGVQEPNAEKSVRGGAAPSPFEIQTHSIEE